jgi:isoleucyl-tRNA synthetase
LELINIKSIKYSKETPEYINTDNWISATEDELSVFINTERDEALLGEGLMRDLARRVQSLRKNMGFVPTEFLSSVHIAELNVDNRRILLPFLDEMANLVRARKIYLHNIRTELAVNWNEIKLDGKKIFIQIH